MLLLRTPKPGQKLTIWQHHDKQGVLANAALQGDRGFRCKTRVERPRQLARRCCVVTIAFATTSAC